MGCCVSKNSSTPQRYQLILSDIFKVVPQQNSTMSIDDLRSSFSSVNYENISNNVKVQTKVLKGHIEDNNIRLIDTANFIENYLLKNNDPSVQLVSLIILDELIKDLHKFTQNIKIKQNQGNQDESKQDMVSSVAASVKEEETDLTFLSDNFIRFEISFLNIINYLLNDEKNKFSSLTLPWTLDVLKNFAKARKENYTSEHIFKVLDVLKKFLINIQSKCATSPKEAKQFLSILQCYQLILKKTNCHGSIFYDNKPIFLNYLLDLISKTNKKEQVFYQIAEKDIMDTCYNIIKIYAEKAFLLKSYNQLLIPLLQFFDKMMFDASLNVLQIMLLTMETAKIEQVQHNYEVFMVEVLLEYLSGGTDDKAQSLQQIPINQPIFDCVFENQNKLETKIRVFTLFASLIENNDKDNYILVYSCDKILNCFFINLIKYNSDTELVRAMKKTFSQYIRTLQPDCIVFIQIMNLISEEIYSILNIKNHLIIENAGEDKKQLVQQSTSQRFRKNSLTELDQQVEQLPSAYDKKKYSQELLNFEKLALDELDLFSNPSIIKHELIFQLILIADKIEFRSDCYLILTKLSTIMLPNLSNNEQSPKNSDSYFKLAMHSVTLIFYQSIYHMQANSYHEIFVSFQIINFIRQICASLLKRTDIYCIQIAQSFTMKLCSILNQNIQQNNNALQQIYVKQLTTFLLFSIFNEFREQKQYQINNNQASPQSNFSEQLFEDIQDLYQLLLSNQEYDESNQQISQLIKKFQQYNIQNEQCNKLISDIKSFMENKDIQDFDKYLQLYNKGGYYNFTPKKVNLGSNSYHEIQLQEERDRISQIQKKKTINVIQVNYNSLGSNSISGNNNPNMSTNNPQKGEDQDDNGDSFQNIMNLLKQNQKKKNKVELTDFMQEEGNNDNQPIEQKNIEIQL